MVLGGCRLLGNNLDGSWVVGLLGNLDGIGVLGNNQQACGVCQGPLASEGGSIHQRQRWHYGYRVLRRCRRPDGKGIHGSGERR